MTSPSSSTPPAAGQAAHTLSRYRVILKSLAHDSAWLAVGTKQLGPMSIGVAKEIALRGNSHAALVGALEQAAARIDTLSRRVSDAGKDDLAELGVQWADQARAALALAKEG